MRHSSVTSKANLPCSQQCSNKKYINIEHALKKQTYVTEIIYRTVIITGAVGTPGEKTVHDFITLQALVLL
jgi:hypothetical protein